MVCVLLAYAVVMACWAIIVAMHRSARSRFAIAFCAVALPIVMVVEVFLMGLSATNPDLGWTVYMPSVAGIVYLVGSIGIVIWAYRERSSISPPGFLTGPIISDGPKQSNSL
jgi:hypothetical protein